LAIAFALAFEHHPAFELADGAEHGCSVSLASKAQPNDRWSRHE
jgi:hypothetical protein